MSVRTVASLLFGSGFAALVYQTAWQRLFQLTFGASTAASAAVLAIFLGGLGIGGLLFGRRVERSEKPLLFYAHLELGIALWAALTPLLRSGVHHLYLALGGSASLGSVGATAVRLVLAALVIGPAVVLMGGTLPAAARATVSDADAGRRGLALLYALNTVGAVAGALIGPLLLFGVFGTELTLWAAVSLNLLVGMIARILGKSTPPIATPAVVPAESEAVAEPAASTPSNAVVWVYFTAAATGFGFLSLELVWFRVLSPILGGSSVTFGLILGLALLGIGSGGLLYSLRSNERPITVELLATTLAAEAIAVMIPFVWGDELALVAAHLRAMVNLGRGYLVGGWVFVALSVVLPAAVVSGYQFPVLFALLGRGRTGIGRHVGEAYAFNTLGTLLGSLLTGFVLLPTLGAVATWRSVAMLFAALSMIGVGLGLREGKKLPLLAPPFATALVALLFFTSSGPGATFRHSAVGAGRVEVSDLSPNQVIELRRQTEDMVVWERDGVESSVGINVLNGIAFIVNGKSDGAVVDDRGAQAFLALLPAVLHPNPKRGFVVGLGTGMTAGALGRTPGIERVDVVELEPSVVEVARRSALANGAVLDNRRVHLFLGDGREALLTSEQSYDLVISEPSNPYRAGVAALFTREFYLAGRARLAPGGLFAQWMQSYETDGKALGTVLGTLRSVFPYVSLWSLGGGDLVLVGSLSPQTIDVDRLRGTLAEPHYVDWMRRAWNLEGVEAFLAHHIARPAIVAALADRMGAPLNTDDLNVLEYSFGRRVGDDAYSATRDLFLTLDLPARRPELQGSVDWAKVDDLAHRIDWTGYLGPPATPKTLATKVGCEGSMNRAAKIWLGSEAPSDIVEVWVAGSMEAIRGSETALGRADALERAGFEAEALLIRSRVAEAKKDLDLAATLLVQAFDRLRKKALPLCDATTRALNRARSLAAANPPRALELLRAVASAPLAVAQSEQYRKYTREAIGARALGTPICVEAFAARHGRTTWDMGPLAARAACLERAKSPEAALAAEELAAFLGNEPESFNGAGSGENSDGAKDD